MDRAPIIELENVTKVYHLGEQKVEALKGISLILADESELQGPTFAASPCCVPSNKGGAFDVQPRHEGTNITRKKVVNDYKTQLIDALIESCAGQSACLSVSVSFGYLRSSLAKPQSSFS